MITVAPLRLLQPVARPAAVRPVTPVLAVRPVARPSGLLQRAGAPQQLSFDFRPVEPGTGR